MSEQIKETSAPHRWGALLRDEDAAEYLGISARLLWQGSSAGRFPAPVTLPGVRATRWRLEDLEEFVRGLKD